MLDLRIGRSSFVLGWLAAVGGIAPTLALGDAPPEKPFVVPKDRAEWDARRPAIWKQVGGEIGIDDPSWGFSARFSGAERLKFHPGVIVEQIHAVSINPRIQLFDGQLLRPDRPDVTDRLPLVVLLVDPCPAGALATTPGWDGRPPAMVLLEMGFAVLIFDDRQFGSPFGHDLPLRAALDLALARPTIDPNRVAVIGLGQTGMTALSLMARDPRITCGVAAIESRAAQATATASLMGAGATKTTQYQELVALCAPRPLCLMIGEPLPLPPSAQSIGRTLERVVKGTYKVYGKEGTGLTFSLFGEFAGHDNVSTRLQWMAGLEHLDKHLRPQGPTHLGHAPEPEPTFDPGDSQVLNLTADGIAGWSSEMSFRDSTWTWVDGVAACRPGPHEYGWLRCPVEVDDFLLQVEWKVPERGNAGIFLRARPVDWVLPPSEENRLRVMALGLTWPSRTGLELQTQADPGEVGRYSTGSLYRHAAPCANPTHPNQWNRSTVRARGPRVEVWNNGEQVLDADLNRCGDTLPNPPLRGYIGLQNHGAPAEYRAIKLKRLPPESGGSQGGASGEPTSIKGGSASR